MIARRGSSPRRWVALAAFLVLAGIFGSVLGARVVAGNDRQRTRTAFTSSAREVASTLRLAIQHEEDLVVGARAFIVGNPDSSRAAFVRWTTTVGALARYPELEGGGEVAFVRASRLAAFAARQNADPPPPLPGTPAAGPFQVVPPGSRPFYCLLALSFGRKAQTSSALPAGLDYCAVPSSLRTAFLTARDSGRNSYLPYRSGPTTSLVVEAPIYRGGVVPASVAGRRREFVGGFGTTLIPKIILDTALGGHPDMAVELRYGSGSSPVVFRSGASVRGAQVATIGLGDGWTVRASGAPVGGGVLVDASALRLLGGGIALSALLGLLLFVLGTGRARALAMVRVKTREVSHQALHDALTGLPNRALVLDRAEGMLARARRQPGLEPAALYVDIDRFKYVNDNFGHAVGDHLLKTVAERLLGVVRDQDTVGRLGGDEFIVLLEAEAGQAPPDLVAERLLQVLHQPVVLDDGETTFSSSVSIGIAIGRRPSADELIRDADLALYTAKAAGKDRAVLFEATMQSSAEARLRLEGDLDDAIENGQFLLLYQPIVELSSSRVIGVEALIRWRHPERGIVEPDEFIPLAEETGRIVAIGRWVLEEACQQAAMWHEQGHQIGMSVNVSAVQLDREGFIGDIEQALRASGIEPSSLTLEITETALMRDVSAASERLRRIKRLGVHIAIDDFGAGSSSLAYLRRFSVDSLKIDRAFVAGLTDSRDSTAIIRTLVDLGKRLNIKTLAEGIEQAGQLRQLQLERCDLGQGFLFAHPLNPEEIERFLQGNDTASKVGSPA